MKQNSGTNKTKTAEVKTEELDLYSLLNVSKDADRDTIKKAYKMLALKVHPDKNPDDSEAAEKFTNIHNAYLILIDEEKRRLYDTTGEIDDSCQVDLEGTYEYFKHVYPTITEKDIEDFTLKYKNSEMEREDLIMFYKEYNGDMKKLLHFIPLSSNEDVKRLISIYEALFQEKKLKKNKKFTSTKDKVSSIHEDDAEEVQKEKDKLKDLCSQIIAKKSARESSLNFLKNKYCSPEEEYEDIDDEEFERIQKKYKPQPKGRSKK